MYSDKKRREHGRGGGIPRQGPNKKLFDDNGEPGEPLEVPGMGPSRSDRTSLALRRAMQVVQEMSPTSNKAQVDQLTSILGVSHFHHFHFNYCCNIHSSFNVII